MHPLSRHQEIAKRSICHPSNSCTYIKAHSDEFLNHLNAARHRGSPELSILPPNLTQDHCASFPGCKRYTRAMAVIKMNAPQEPPNKLRRLHTRQHLDRAPRESVGCHWQGYEEWTLPCQRKLNRG